MQRIVDGKSPMRSSLVHLLHHLRHHLPPSNTFLDHSDITNQPPQSYPTLTPTWPSLSPTLLPSAFPSLVNPPMTSSSTPLLHQIPTLSLFSRTNTSTSPPLFHPKTPTYMGSVSIPSLISNWRIIKSLLYGMPTLLVSIGTLTYMGLTRFTWMFGLHRRQVPPMGCF